VLGKFGTVSPEDARERCQKVLGNLAHSRHPLLSLGGTDGITLGTFIADTYTTWVHASRPRTAANTLEKSHRLVRTWYPEPFRAITVERIESWEARRLNVGRSGTTVLRNLLTLASVLRRAVKAGELTENPVMSLRYAHLALDQRREAVAKLNDRPGLALTLRLQWQAPQPPCSIRLI
jgi:hypothetical protein